jgi:hypothetical protein
VLRRVEGVHPAPAVRYYCMRDCYVAKLLTQMGGGLRINRCSYNKSAQMSFSPRDMF